MTTLALFKRQEKAEPELEVVLSSHVECVSVQAGDVVVRQGEFADAFYVIHDGEFTVLLDAEPRSVALCSLGPGDCFGETGLLQTRYRTATVVAATDGQLVVLGESELRQIVTEAQLTGVDLNTTAYVWTTRLEWDA